MKRLHVRTRLTLWYVAVLAGILALYAAGMSHVFLIQLREQVDHHASEQIETLEGYFYFRPDGRLDLRTDYHDHPYPSGEAKRFIEVRALDGTGKILYRNADLGMRELDGMPRQGEGLNTYSPRTVELAGGPTVRLISRQHPVAGQPLLIRLGLSEEHLRETFRHAVLGLLAWTPISLGLAGLGGYFLARRALRPIDEMAKRAREINAEQLNARLTLENPDDELGRLAKAFNDTLARLEKSFEQLRRFTSDAAHELRTPLTAIRSVGEVGLQKKGDAVQYRETIESMLEEATRLGRLVDGLLAVARADAGQVKLDRRAVPVLRQVKEVAALLDVLMEEKRQTLTVAGDDAAVADADRVIFRQILINLLDNAIKYSPHGGHVDVTVRRVDPRMAEVIVADSGPGIAPEHRERIFDRFYRIDQARARSTGGVGLGLAIAKWGAQAHGGDLELAASEGDGCTFRLTVPAHKDL